MCIYCAQKPSIGGLALLGSSVELESDEVKMDMIQNQYVIIITNSKNSKFIINIVCTMIYLLYNKPRTPKNKIIHSVNFL